MSTICGFHDTYHHHLEVTGDGHDRGVDVLGSDVVGALPSKRPAGRLPYGPPAKVKGPRAAATTAKARKSVKNMKGRLASVAKTLKKNKRVVEKSVKTAIKPPVVTKSVNTKSLTKIKGYGFEGNTVELLQGDFDNLTYDVLGATVPKAPPKNLTPKQRQALDKQKSAEKKALTAAKKADDKGKKLFETTKKSIAAIKAQAAKVKASRTKTRVRGDVIGFMDEIIGSPMMEIIGDDDLIGTAMMEIVGTYDVLGLQPAHIPDVYDGTVVGGDEDSLIDPTTGEAVDTGLPPDAPKMFSYDRSSNYQKYDSNAITKMPPNAILYTGKTTPGFLGSYSYFYGTVKTADPERVYGFVYGGKGEDSGWPGSDPNKWIWSHGKKGDKGSIPDFPGQQSGVSGWWDNCDSFDFGQGADQLSAAVIAKIQANSIAKGYGPLIGNIGDTETTGLRVDSEGNVFWLREDAPESAVAEEKYLQTLIDQETARLKKEEEDAAAAEAAAEEAARQKEIADQEAAQALEMDQAQHEADVAAMQQQQSDAAAASQTAASQSQLDIDMQRTQMEMMRQQQEFQMKQADQQAEMQRQWMEQGGGYAPGGYPPPGAYPSGGGGYQPSYGGEAYDPQALPGEPGANPSWGNGGFSSDYEPNYGYDEQFVPDDQLPVPEAYEDGSLYDAGVLAYEQE